MQINLDKYKTDLKKLVDLGTDLRFALQLEFYPKEFEVQCTNAGMTTEKFIAIKKTLPSFKDKYQEWYSEALVCVKQLLPDRLSDFIKQYEKPKGRKSITADNYVIEDALHSINLVERGEIILDEKAAIPKFNQQLDILKSTRKRFESSLFDIKQLVQADLFDSELESANEMLKKGFFRAAGAIAGVILEKHLKLACGNHTLPIAKKNPTIADLNDILKGGDIVEIPVWRHIQYMGDLRNLADHNKDREPTRDEMADLINGVIKVTKTVF